ncbi:MAG TPA: hypothetical protein VEB64_12330 [Azospirillaceae bacterium]|nr:hypothetical protein [Azospirillaceae bacterium]
MHTPIHFDDARATQTAFAPQIPDVHLATAVSQHIEAALDCLAELAERAESMALLRVLTAMADQLEEARRDTVTLSGFLRGKADRIGAMLPM